ncbi:GlcG/HbpS family heme-binding protein [Pseudomonas sp. Z4-20]|uniref:GlcG/HbpS family heme-binding protein n=1 Tax=Pseudomonas sp. Z4-20 TaxID=2817414 RepID=UPI003DA8651D
MKLLPFALAAAFALAAVSAHAQVPAPAPALKPLTAQTVSKQAVISQKNLSYVHAMQLAQTAVAVCALNNQSVAATVVDRSGVVLASLRSNGAGPTSYAGSERKAYTAVSFKTPTGTLMERSVNVPNLSNIPGTLALTGGVPIKVGNDVIGAIGVGGAPSGRIDEQCAEYAINELRPLLGS